MQRIIISGPRSKLTTPLAKLPGPIVKFFEALFTDTRSDVDQTGFKVCELNGSDLVHGHVKESLAQRA